MSILCHEQLLQRIKRDLERKLNKQLFFHFGALDLLFIDPLLIFVEIEGSENGTIDSVASESIVDS